MRLNARVAGDGPPLILVHGLFGSLENLGMVARLFTDYFEVHSLDMRNHGRSPHTEAMNYDLMVADIAAYLDQKSIPQAVFLGHSMGGKTVMQMALKFPARVQALIVADIAPVKYEARHDAVFQGLTSLDVRQIASRTEADKLLARHVKELPVRQFLLKNLVKRGAGGFEWRMNLETIQRNYPQLMLGQSSEKPFDGPVLFIKGGQSDYLQPQHAGHVNALFSNSQVKVIPGAGHWLHAEKPELFTTICKRFLAGSGLLPETDA